MTALDEVLDAIVTGMTTIDPDAPVLVTGASGYIGSWIVRYLLEAGHTVHGTVRNPQKPTGLEHLHKLSADHPGKLKLFKADLLDVGSFDEAMAGCELVMHTASPFLLQGVTDAQESLVRPALEGTRNVLDAVNRTESVKRVVLTSSVVAIYGDARESRDVPGGVFTEDQWNTTSSVDHQPYSYSKTVAEQEAWRYQKAQDRWDLVTIHPGLVLGPSLTSASDSASLATMKQFADGTMLTGAPELTSGIVDVRDVADAHVRAGYTPEAHDRYLVNAASLSLLEIGQILRAKFGVLYPFPWLNVPKLAVKAVAPVIGLTREFVDTNVGYPLVFDASRSQSELGLVYRPIEQTVTDHFQQMLDDGIVRKRPSIRLP
ncbi:NAD-dependent epimerase [Mycolicibacterium sp. TY66]|uniref:SDR family oxidoreductase n=1 Tax=Mycobacteriaceae TaxID=1762 RepID=UPI001BB3DA84|nr:MULTISPECIES: aldehyde reductase [unclassified Mycolicibacterium]BCI79228.1 NAD-dependent epimerase [Mycolicibacterium sp. TY66]BCJ83109.1 NAD-dependent epimerase [Mycolicibacterium sp. TY81]